MADLDKAVVARLKKGKLQFEIMVDPDKAMDFRNGKCNLDDVLATYDIYTDVKKSIRATKEQKLAAFNTDDEEEIAAIIVREGEIPLTTEHKNKLREQTRKRIVELLHKNAVDAQTGLPHPVERIERAMEQKHVKIDETKTPEQQLKAVAEKLSDILPLKFETRVLEIKVPASFGPKAYGLIKNLGNMTKSEWMPDGSLLAHIEIPAGMHPEIEDKIHEATKGSAEIAIAKSNRS